MGAANEAESGHLELKRSLLEGSQAALGIFRKAGEAQGEARIGKVVGAPPRV